MINALIHNRPTSYTVIKLFLYYQGIVRPVNDENNSKGINVIICFT
jgi:hypothetical protein